MSHQDKVKTSNYFFKPSNFLNKPSNHYYLISAGLYISYMACAHLIFPEVAFLQSSATFLAWCILPLGGLVLRSHIYTNQYLSIFRKSSLVDYSREVDNTQNLPRLSFLNLLSKQENDAYDHGVEAGENWKSYFDSFFSLNDWKYFRTFGAGMFTAEKPIFNLGAQLISRISRLQNREKTEDQKSAFQHGYDSESSYLCYFKSFTCLNDWVNRSEFQEGRDEAVIQSLRSQKPNP